MVLNPAGYQVVFDFGNPKNISGRAREAISGGQLVFLSGAAAVVSSGVSSFSAATDLQFATGASGLNFTGIAAYTVGSNSLVTVSTDVAIICTSAGTILAGTPVGANGGDAVVPLLSGSAAGTQIGRALTSAGSEGYCLVKLGQV